MLAVAAERAGARAADRSDELAAGRGGLDADVVRVVGGAETDAVTVPSSSCHVASSTRPARTTSGARPNACGPTKRMTSTASIIGAAGTRQSCQHPPTSISDRDGSRRMWLRKADGFLLACSKWLDTARPTTNGALRPRDRSSGPGRTAAHRVASTRTPLLPPSAELDADICVVVPESELVREEYLQVREAAKKRVATSTAVSASS